MVSIKRLWLHWRGASASLFETLSRFRCNGVTLSAFMLIFLFLAGLVWGIMPFQKLGQFESLQSKIQNWIGFVCGLAAFVQLLIMLDAMAKDGVIFDKDSSEDTGGDYTEIDSDSLECARGYVFGEFILADGEKEFFHRVPCGVQIDPSGGFTLFAFVNASVEHSFMNIPMGTTHQLGELIKRYSADAKLRFFKGSLYWRFRREPGLLIRDESEIGSISFVAIVMANVAQRDAVVKAFSTRPDSPIPVRELGRD